MSVVFADIETYSERDLADCGSYNYATNPSTDVIVLCFAIDDGEVQVWRPGMEVPAVFADPTEHIFVFDNWTFERSILEHVLVPRYKFASIPLAQQDCAQRRALASAFPAELGKRCEALDLPYRKDKAARDAMLRLTRPQKPKRKRKQKQKQKHKQKHKQPELLAEILETAARERDLELLIQRCKLDVEMTRATYNHPDIREPLPTERHVLLADAEVNARGVHVNTPFLEAALKLAEREYDTINQRLSELTGGVVTKVSQTERIKEVVNAHGHNMTTLGKRSVSAALAHQPDDFTREILTLRQRGGFASPTKFKTLLSYIDSNDHRIRDVLRFHGAGPGRWTSIGAQLHNLTRNDAEFPASLIDALMRGDYAELARYGNPIAVVSQLSRAALCAAPGQELICADLGAIESRITAWVAGEDWKLAAFSKYDSSGDERLHIYRQTAARMLRKDVLAITKPERQMGKGAELACGFGGAVGAWRRIAHDEDVRSDAEVQAIVKQWRAEHPRICAFWRRLMIAARTAIVSKRSVPVNPPPLPPMTAAFDGYALTLTLPSSRTINYPGARVVANQKFEDGEPDIEFMDNAKGKWKPVRAWFGVLVENVVQGTARDLLAAAIIRAKERGWQTVFHCHDELVVEAPIGTIPERDVLALLVEPPAWAVGLPLGGKVHSGPLYLEAPATAEPSTAQEISSEDDADSLDESSPYDDVCLTCLDEMRTEMGSHVELVGELPDDRERTQRESPKFSCDFDKAPDQPPWEGDEKFSMPLAHETDQAAAHLHDGFAGFTRDVEGFDREKINCPFHEDKTPSCQLYGDGHYHCFGCGAHGWISEDMDLPDDVLERVTNGAKDETGTLERGLELWDEAKPIADTLAARYLTDTRKLDLNALPADIDTVLRFHAHCPFGGNGARHPCLLALFRDTESDKPAGIHRIGLTPDAKKIRRLTLGRWPNGPRAIKLWPHTDRLSIGEGIETVLGAIRCGAITPPAWATGPKADIANLPVIPGIKALSILVDRGDPAALDGAEACAMRYVAAGCRVRLLRTVRVKDFNDLVMP